MSGTGLCRFLGGVGIGFVMCVALIGCTASSTSGLDGAALVQRRCSVCHTVDRINQAKKDEAGWNTTIDRMRNKGAVVNEVEQQRIIAYLIARS